MVKQGDGGRIINTSSVHEDVAMPTNAPYCAAKGGIRMLMRTIAVELGPHKITVNNIAPGAIFTPIDADVEADPKLNEQILSENPLHRWDSPRKSLTWLSSWPRTPPDTSPARPKSSTGA
jgi:glucose 1-dehydrogenase